MVGEGTASRPRTVSWLATFLYATVLAAGLYSDLARVCPASAPRTAGFVGALLVLAAFEPVERRLYGARTPRGQAIALLALRSGLFVLVSALDCAGTARSLFLLIPFIGYFTLGRRAGYALAALCLGAVVLALSARPGWHTDSEGISDLLMFCIGLVFAIAMAAVAHREDTARARAEGLLAELADSHRRLRGYAGQVAELATAAERNRLARDIHDDVGHHLTVISVQLEKAAAFRDLDPGAADRALADARDSARLALEDVRRSVGSLRTPDETFSLAGALAALAERLRGGGFGVTLDIRGEESGYGGTALLALYHAAQEGLTNACRHAAADQATVRVRLAEREASLLIADEGRGFTPGPSGGFGIQGMRERLEMVGGSLLIDSGPGRGTRVNATVPAGGGHGRG
ncbi:sensor histidine kinase [Actinomadura sp. 9N407]|uniref:sensor histidine kinase n=1 Tax=Actinomadura sp. 9N407 TaxID=3375154 RepID=UPI00378B19C0